jgi:phosphatidylcholine synthase
MALAIIRDAPDFRLAFILMLIATLIDATDGVLARWLRVKEVLPGFDGRRLDDLIDFLTYTCLPLLLLWRAREWVLPPGPEVWLLAPLLASAYGFCQVSAKTDDGYFLGFPSYWNLVAFYIYVLPVPPWLALSLLIGLALLTFVPTRYLYPSQRGGLNRLTNLLAVAWVGLLLAVLLNLPDKGRPTGTVQGLALASLFFPVYYLIASWAVSIRHWRKRRSQHFAG